MFDKIFDEIVLLDIELLIESSVPEGRRLEYKRDHYLPNDKGKKEFAADISAMANASGGILIIGIEEDNGVAAKIVGIPIENPDKLILAVTEAIRASLEPQIIGVRVKYIEISTEKGLILIHVPRSLASPHRVIVAKDSRFYIRDENGKHPMSVNELRHAFLFGNALDNQIRKFRTERLELLHDNEGPFATNEKEPTLVIHVVPQVAFSENHQIKISDHHTIPPMGARGWNSLYSIDGLVTYSGPEERIDAVRAFSTLFNNGSVEAVGRIYTGDEGDVRSVSAIGIEDEIISTVSRILGALDHYKVPVPIYVMVSIVGIRGIHAPLADRWSGSITYPCRRKNVILPELVLNAEEKNEPTEKRLHTIINLMWNAFGHSGSPNYDKAGNYHRN